MSTKGKIYATFIMAINKIAKKIIKADRQYRNIDDIDLIEIRELKEDYGIEGIIFDIDGTLIQNMEEITEENKLLLKILKKEFQIYIISNNKDLRIKKVAEELGIKYIPSAKKPSRTPFINASKNMGIKPSQIIVIGDEFLTDIWGGKRSGMHTAIIEKKAKKAKKDKNDRIE